MWYFQNYHLKKISDCWDFRIGLFRFSLSPVSTEKFNCAKLASQFVLSVAAERLTSTYFTENLKIKRKKSKIKVKNLVKSLWMAKKWLENQNLNMDPEFERRLSKPNSGCIRAMSNGIVASPMSPNGTPTKGVRSSPATPMSSVNPDFFNISSLIVSLVIIYDMNSIMWNPCQKM